MFRMYRYSIEGMSYLLIDGRNVPLARFRNRRTVHALCLMNVLDGLLILSASEQGDFKAESFGADGNPSDPSDQECVCLVAFADLLGVKPFHTKNYSFESCGRIRAAEILSHLGECKTVRFENGYAGSAVCEGEFE